MRWYKVKNNIFKRYEIKYLITKDQQEKLKILMEEYMVPDKFYKTTNCNIYFDTPEKLLIRRSLEKPVYKEKLRVRSYGVANEDSKVFIELKKKYQGIVYKRRIALDEKQAMEYLCERKELDGPNQISKEVDYFLDLYQGIEPSIFLAYERESYASKTDSNFRMTFDQNILFREHDLSLTKGIYGEHILDSDKVLLEVKTGLGIPMWLTTFFSENRIYKTSFSKYGKAYQEIILSKSLGGNTHVA